MAEFDLAYKYFKLLARTCADIVDWIVAGKLMGNVIFPKGGVLL